MKKYLLAILSYLFVSLYAYSQSNQQKAQELVTKYFNSNSRFKSSQILKFNPIEVLRSSFENTKLYKNFAYKIDSLTIVGRKIDARIPKLKTTAEITQSKKDSKNLSNQLVATSDAMIDYMTEYKGPQIGWILKTVYHDKTIRKKKFYLNQELTKVDSIK